MSKEEFDIDLSNQKGPLTPSESEALFKKMASLKKSHDKFIMRDEGRDLFPNCHDILVKSRELLRRDNAEHN